MTGRQRRRGEPYDVGYGKPPKQNRFKKGHSGNPCGRPRKKPDLYAELRRVLNESITVTREGVSEQVTVQQALLLRLRDQALRGDVWASKLLQKVIDAIPEGGTQYDGIERAVDLFRAKTKIRLMFERDDEKTGQDSNTAEGSHVD